MNNSQGTEIAAAIMAIIAIPYTVIKIASEFVTLLEKLSARAQRIQEAAAATQMTGPAQDEARSQTAQRPHGTFHRYLPKTTRIFWLLYGVMLGLLLISPPPRSPLVLLHTPVAIYLMAVIVAVLHAGRVVVARIGDILGEMLDAQEAVLDVLGQTLDATREHIAITKDLDAKIGGEDASR